MRATVAVVLALVAMPVAAQGLDGPELYAGEAALYEQAAREGAVTALNTPPGFANWGQVIRGFEQRYPSVLLTYNAAGQGQAMEVMERTRGRPPADVVYLPGFVAVDAASRGLLASLPPDRRPPAFERIPPVLRDPQAQWVAVHQAPIVFAVNKRRVRVPVRSWADLRRPELRGQVVYASPRSLVEGVGVVLAATMAAGQGAALETVQPGLDLLGEVHRAGAIQRIETQTTIGPRFLRGEIGVWVGLEHDILRTRFLDGFGDDLEVVAPAEGTAALPFAVAIIRGARNEAAARLWLNYVLSDAGQRLFAEGLVRPSVPIALPPELAQRLPAIARMETPDQLRIAFRLADIQRGWARLPGAN
ncbi:MAG: extracellular solute-binding protein [Alphaproteobacteria bacterium]|nr:MAG: extracellular solute-binding protein [Alphaproteobacteria bacterium]